MCYTVKNNTGTVVFEDDVVFQNPYIERIYVNKHNTPLSSVRHSKNRYELLLGWTKEM